MSRPGKLWFFSLALTFIAACAGCSHKPAYSDIDANRTARNQNAETQAASSQPPAVAEATPASASQASPSQTETVKPPAFMTATGTIKDVPSYPRAVRVNVQFGPVQQATVMTLVLRTRDSMEKVQAFYTQAIKENKWTVTDKLLDPELSQWTLNKDERNNAKVEVRKDLKTGSMEIAIVRAEKFETPK